VITSQQIADAQEQIGLLCVDAANLDLDAFIEVTEQVGSPQALAAGLDLRVVQSAAEWTDLAKLLKPFRDAAIERLRQIGKEIDAGR
jgi:hypothetical protein